MNRGTIREYSVVLQIPIVIQIAERNDRYFFVIIINIMGLDKFYTKEKIAKECVELIPEINSYDFIIVTARKRHQNALHLGGDELLFFF